MRTFSSSTLLATASAFAVSSMPCSETSSVASVSVWAFSVSIWEVSESMLAIRVSSSAVRLEMFASAAASWLCISASTGSSSSVVSPDSSWALR